MASHADILDRPEPLTVPFWVSLTMHILVLGGLSAGAFLQNRSHLNMGSPTGGGFGVLVSPVASIPLPNRGGAENPVANDTQSQVPTPPTPKAKPKPAPKAKPLTPDEILLQQMEKAPNRRQPERAAQPNKFRDQKQYSDNQLYSESGQRMNSSEFAVPGGGGVRIGDSSPFGEQFGTYANIIRDAIARNWKPTVGRAAGAPFVIITFTIRRNGSVTNLKVGKPSGIDTLDYSAQRAVLDAQLPALPPNFPRNQADVELRFELGN
jgi:protein TonB